MKNPFKTNLWTNPGGPRAGGRGPVWSDPVKWWMDLLKNGLTFLLGTVITVSFVKQCDRRQFEWQSQYGYRLSTLKEYEKSGFIYLNWSYDAFQEACSCKRPQTSERMRGWMDEGYDEFSYALSSIGAGSATGQLTTELQKTVDSLSLEESNFRSMHNQLLSQMNGKKPSFCQSDSTRLFWNSYRKTNYFPQRSKMNQLHRRVMQLAQQQLSGL